MYRKFFPGKNIQTVMFWRKKLPIDGFQDRKRKKKKKNECLASASHSLPIF